MARVVAWHSPNLTTCFGADCYIKCHLSRRGTRNSGGIWSYLLEEKSWKQSIFGVRRKWAERAYKLLGRRANPHVTRGAALHSAPRTKGSQFKLWKGLFQKAAGQNFLPRRVLNVWGKKEGAKQREPRQQRGIISVNSLRFLFLPFFFLFNALDKPQEEEYRGINICSLELDRARHGLCGLGVSSCARGFYLCFSGPDSSESGL